MNQSGHGKHAAPRPPSSTPGKVFDLHLFLRATRASPKELNKTTQELLRASPLVQLLRPRSGQADSSTTRAFAMTSSPLQTRQIMDNAKRWSVGGLASHALPETSADDPRAISSQRRTEQKSRRRGTTNFDRRPPPPPSPQSTSSCGVPLVSPHAWPTGTQGRPRRGNSELRLAEVLES